MMEEAVPNRYILVSKFRIPCEQTQVKHRKHHSITVCFTHQVEYFHCTFPKFKAKLYRCTLVYLLDVPKIVTTTKNVRRSSFIRQTTNLTDLTWNNILPYVTERSCYYRLIQIKCPKRLSVTTKNSGKKRSTTVKMYCNKYYNKCSNWPPTPWIQARKRLMALLMAHCSIENGILSISRTIFAFKCSRVAAAGEYTHLRGIPVSSRVDFGPGNRGGHGPHGIRQSSKKILRQP